MDAFNGFALDWSAADYRDDACNDPFGSISPSATSTVSSSSCGSLSDRSQEFVFPSVDGVEQLPQCKRSVNKLGGMYTSGKPLPLAIRRKIVAMSEMGMKACDISRQLQISHGCVSKIITKWRATGSFEPRRIGGSKPKKTLPEVIAAVRMYKRVCPSMHSLEIRRRLLADAVCTEHNVPSLSSINRIIRMKLRDEVAQFEASLVRDLMAILTGATSSQVNCKYSPAPNGEMKSGECAMEEMEMDTDNEPSSSSEDYSSPVHFEHTIPSAPFPEATDKLFNCNDIQFPIYGANLLGNSDETSAQQNVIAVDDRPSWEDRNEPTFDLDSFTLATPLPYESSAQNAESKFRNFDASGMTFNFDVEENIWSWLDQVP